MSIVARSHESFVARFADMDSTQPFAERIDLFVARMWDHYRSEVYLATIEIIMAERDPEQEDLPLTTFDWPNQDHLEMMVRIFGDQAVVPEDLLEGLIFLHCLLTGLAIQEVLEGKKTAVEQSVIAKLDA